MFKGKLTSKKVTNYLMITFLLLSGMCLVCILISFLLLLRPHIIINDWDFLSFLGSMIVAVITIIGIRVPILSQRKERLISQYESELKQLHLARKETRFIINVPSYDYINPKTGEKDIIKTAKINAEYLNEYINIIEKFMSSFINSMNWDSYEVLDIKFSTLASFKFHYSRVEGYFEFDVGTNFILPKIKEYLDKAVELEEFLIQYQEEVLKEYKSISKKSEFSLFNSSKK